MIDDISIKGQSNIIMSSYNSFLNKPENALRRAQELSAISQPGAALSLLHEALSSRRHKTWSITYEKMIVFYLDLCLDLNRAREAKDGLHQYRNLSQSQAPGSLEGVIRHLVEKAERKCRDARDAVDAGAAAGGGTRRRRRRRPPVRPSPPRRRRRR